MFSRAYYRLLQPHFQVIGHPLSRTKRGHTAQSKHFAKFEEPTLFAPASGARRIPPLSIFALWFAICSISVNAEVFRVATYNIENYLDEPTRSRPAKSAEAKAKVQESILALKPDVLAVEEMGSLSALHELQQSLKAKGLDLPYWQHVQGFDTNVHVALLSKYPFRAEHPHTNDAFLLNGKRFQVSRGFAEAEIEVTSNFTFTVLAAHLKSKRPIPQADESELRLEEAKVLREKVDAILAANPNAMLVVLGDMNDTKNAASTKAIIGRGKTKLIDCRPVERNGDDLGSGTNRKPTRNIAWTHFYAVEDTYSRLDYIFVSAAMATHWVTNQSFVLSIPNWGVGSDHRPVTISLSSD
jgi:endonuclease/exonuclease/phosphatase family metal-dependent hydrolase